MQSVPMAESSKIFRPFRALGLYCNAVPCIIQSRGTETFVTASIGRSFQIFDCAKLTLSFVSSDSLPKKIRALAAFGDLTFTAVGCDIYAWYRGRIKFKMEEHNSQVVLLLCLGKHLVSICKSSVIHVWDCEDGLIGSSLNLSINSFCQLTAFPISIEPPKNIFVFVFTLGISLGACISIAILV